MKNTKVPIVILHGWRLTGEKYLDIKQIFEENGYKVFSPTLPGSGGISLTRSVMKLDDYVNYVIAYLSENKIKKAIFIGHSFGGRIATKLAVSYPQFVDTLILTGAPLIRQPISFKKKALLYLAIPFKPLRKLKTLRKYFYIVLGETDYIKAPKELLETFKNIITEDLAKLLPYVSVPTLIVWGEEDTFVGKHIGKKISEIIPKSTYKGISKASHKLPYEKPEEFAKVVLEFLKTK